MILLAKLDQADHRYHQKWTFATIHRVETSRLDPSSHLVQRKVNKSKHAQSTRHKNAQNVAFCHPRQNLWISPTCIFALLSGSNKNWFESGHQLYKEYTQPQTWISISLQQTELSGCMNWIFVCAREMYLCAAARCICVAAKRIAVLHM